MSEQSIHANCFIVGTKGILIRGDAGSGKSELTDFVLDQARAKGHYGRLVADDRVRLTAKDGRVLAQVPDAIAGLMEVRGHAVVETPFTSLARVQLVADLQPLDFIDRLPEQSVSQTNLEGVALPLLICPQNKPVAAIRLLRWALRQVFPRSPDYF